MMSFREGYKQTEVGVIPEEWEVVRLNEVGKIVGGGTPSTSISNYWNGDIAWLTPSEIKQKYILDSQRKITKEGLSNSSAKLLPAGTVLITTRATIGDVGIAKKEVSTNQGFQSIIPNQENYNEYIYYWVLQNKQELLKRANGSTFIEISKKKIEKIPFLRPPLPEQQKIAAILTSVDNKIEVIDSQIAKTETLKKGLIQKLLSEGIGHLEFKDSEIGRIPKEWEVVELDNVSNITRLAGYEYSEYWDEKEEGDILALKGYNIGKGKIVYRDTFYITNKLSEQLIRSKLFVGDVVFPVVGTIGNAVAITENNKFHINQNIAKISPDNALDSNYLVQFLMSNNCRKEINRFNATTSQPNVLVGSLRKFRLPLPPLQEQKQIAKILSTTDDKLDTLRAKKERYETLKKGLMQKLLTGEVRVKV